MKYSLVIPAYNGVQYIEEAICSVLNQTRAFEEVIVSDDNSTDSSLEICSKYRDKIEVYSNDDGPSGFVAGWNKAVGRATGDYICILHQDDRLEPTYLEEADRILAEYRDVLHFFTTCNYMDENGMITGVSYPDMAGEIRRYSGLEYMKAYQREGAPHIHRCPGVITHRSIFDKIQYNPTAGHIADDDFFYRVGRYTDVIGLLKPLASYRVHKQSETGRLDDMELAKRLVRDYGFQLKQWKNSSFIDREAYDFFCRNRLKYKKRLLGYSLKQKIRIKT